MSGRGSSKYVIGCLAALVLIGGCAPKSIPVFVDVPLVLATTAVKATPQAAEMRPPPPTPAFNLSLPAQPAQTIPDRKEASGAAVTTEIGAAQARAVQELETRLRNVYENEISKFSIELDRKRTESELKASDAASEQIRVEFLAYAKVRGPLFTRLALLAGFPDPNPLNKPSEKPLPPALQLRFQEAADLRSKMTALDVDFQTKVDAILQGVKSQFGSDLAAARKQIADYKSQLDLKARQEAHSQVRTNMQELQLKLIQPRKLTLAAVPGHSIHIPAQAPLPPEPQVISRGILQGESDRLLLIRHELQIWAGINNYSVVQNPKAANHTNEFLTWRRQFEVGP